MSALFDAVIRGAIRNRAVVLLAALALLVAALASGRSANLDALPSFYPPRVTVQTEAPGYGSAAVERQVTTPLEQALLGIPGLATTRSTSSAGLSVIDLTFADGTDIFRARQLVGERIAAAHDRLPATLEAPRLAPIASPVGALLKLAYTVDDGSRETFVALSRFVQWQIAPRLEALEGIARVTVHGAATTRVEARPDPVAMVAHGIGLSDLRHALETAQSRSALGRLRNGTQRVALRADALWSLGRWRQIGRTVVTARDATPVRVGDVAEVDLGSEPAVGTALEDGKQAVYVQIDKLPWADTLRLTERTERALAALDGAAPPGSHRQRPVFRQADFIETSLWSVGRALLIGSLLVIAVLLAFLRSPRLAAISLTALPLSILAAALVLVVRGVTINGMVLGGLAIAVGEVVDDAIVDVENIWRRLRDNASAASPRPTLAVIHDASVEVRGAVVYASLIIVAVLVPVLTVGGLAGRIFSPLAESYALAILASLVVALTVTPALSAVLLARHDSLALGDGALTRRVRRAYERVLEVVSRRPRHILLGSAVTGALALAAMPLLGGDFLPEFREGVLIGELDAWPGTSLEETTRLARRVMAGLRGSGGLPHVAARIGRASLDEDAAPVHRIEMDLVLPPGSRDPEDMAATILDRMAEVPGLRFSIDGFLGERINELLSGERAPLALELSGDNLPVLRATAGRLLDRIARIPGIRAVRSRNLVDIPTTDLQPDPAALALAGIRRSAVVDAAATLRQGLPVTALIGPHGFQVPVVIAAAKAWTALDRMSDAPVRTADGDWLPLSSLVHTVNGTEPATIHHEGGRRVVTVSAQAPAAELSRVANAVDDVVASAHLPRWITWRLAGQAAARRRASTRLIITALLVLGTVLVFLWMAFRSFVDAAVVIAGLPLGLVGGVAAASLLPDGLSMAGLVGFVTLIGIISRNGIMLVTHKNHLLCTHPGGDPAEIILRAARERLLPILMTAATAFLGLLPLAASIESAGSELEAPMAIIVCGGLLSSTALNLVAVPSFYLWRARRRAGRKPRP